MGWFFCQNGENNRPGGGHTPICVRQRHTAGIQKAEHKTTDALIVSRGDPIGMMIVPAGLHDLPGVSVNGAGQSEKSDLYGW